VSWLSWFGPPALLRTVIVNLKDDPTVALRGVLWSWRGPWLIFRDAAALKAGANPTPLDGEVIVHRANVSFMQVLP
jgi:hypothetical protein